MTNLNESAVETREDIPLKSGPKSSSLRACNEYLFEGPRFVTTAFIFLTTIITIALIIQIYYGDFQVVPHGSVATDSKECSQIGTLVLKQGGNAVDAAIASAICLAVVNPHTSGLDASSSILIYNHKSREDATSFNFIDYTDQNQTLPKLIINLAQLHQIYGHLPWKELISPSAELAMRGFTVSKQFQQAIKKAKVKKIFGQVVAGQQMIMETLANTLRSISEIPTEDLYEQVSHVGKIKKIPSRKGSFNNFNVFIPGSKNIGQYLLTNLKYIEELNFTREEIYGANYMYQLVNVTQIVYNTNNVLSQFHQGTSSNIAVMDFNDIYVSLVIGMFAQFGSQHMTDYGYILDLKSSMPYSILPLIITDDKYVCAKRFVLGVNDVSVASQIITHWTYGIKNTTSVIEYPRFMILNNNVLGFEDSSIFGDEVLRKIEELGTKTSIMEPFSSCNFVEKFTDILNSHSDSRGGGISSRF